MAHENILVIGNGFDLYHGLPTRYIDFLQLAKIRRDKPNNKEIVIGEHYKDICFKKVIPISKCNLNAVKRFDEIVENNSFVKYFIIVGYNKENWIDFEQEIETILESIECAFLKGVTFFEKSKFVRVNRLRYEKIIDIEIILNMLKEDLNELIEVIDIFFSEFIDKIDIEMQSTLVSSIHAMEVINFNYTNTYKIYNNANVHHIHGEIGKNNIVLGIRDDVIKDNNFIYFKKYFQRIQKRTGLKYKQWINKIKFKNDKRIFHIIGHSLDNTDGDILRDIMCSEKTDRVVIYYHSQKAYEQQVINLINVLSKETFLELYEGFKIIFEKLPSNTNFKIE